MRLSLLFVLGLGAAIVKTARGDGRLRYIATSTDLPGILASGDNEADSTQIACKRAKIRCRCELGASQRSAMQRVRHACHKSNSGRDADSPDSVRIRLPVLFHLQSSAR